MVGCGDGELVMVVEGAVKKPPPGRVTFPTQVQHLLTLVILMSQIFMVVVKG